jgi:hypothetical protein
LTNLVYILMLFLILHLTRSIEEYLCLVISLLYLPVFSARTTT